MKVLVTGASGFVGRNLVPYLSKNQIEVVCLDKAKPSQDWEYHKNYYAYTLGSYKTPMEGAAETIKDVSVVVHLASESHVDRSITGPSTFIDNNVKGTLELFELCRHLPNLEKIVLFSTDEIGACLTEGTFYEKNEFNCGSVYSATKGAQELLAQAYIKTFNLPIITTRCVNIFGPHQWDEKFIPTVCRSAIQGKPIPIYGSGMQQRQWVSVNHVCEFVNYLCVGTFIPPGTILHITGTSEIYNISMARSILNFLGKGSESIEHVKDRPGHDERYSLGRGRSTEDFGCPEYDVKKFDKDLMETVKFYKEKYE